MDENRCYLSLASRNRLQHSIESSCIGYSDHPYLRTRPLCLTDIIPHTTAPCTQPIVPAADLPSAAPQQTPVPLPHSILYSFGIPITLDRRPVDGQAILCGASTRQSDLCVSQRYFASTLDGVGGSHTPIDGLRKGVKGHRLLFLFGQTPHCLWV